MSTSKIAELEARIRKIENRNIRVEADKAWETSLLRRGAIAVLTYITIVTFFHAARLPDPWINALIPTLAFLLSTLSLALLREIFKK